MCDPVTAGLIISGTSAATGAASALHAANTRAKPKKPQMQAEVKQPRITDTRDRNRGGPAYGGRGSLLSSAGSTTGNTLLGQ